MARGHNIVGYWVDFYYRFKPCNLELTDAQDTLTGVTRKLPQVKES